MHAGFLLGPRSFYAALNALPESERRLFDMRGVAFINQLYGDDLPLRVAQRNHARFVNTTMMLTTLGAAVSDGLADGRVVSGVGGQYNFVAMAHAFPVRARSCACAPRAARTANSPPTSSPATGIRRFRAICATSPSPSTESPTCAAVPTPSASPRCSTSPTRASRRNCSRPPNAPTRSMRVTAFRLAPSKHPGTPRRSLHRTAARRPVLRIPFRNGSHARGNRTRAGLRWLKDHMGTRWQRLKMIARSLATRVDLQDQPYLETGTRRARRHAPEHHGRSRGARIEREPPARTTYFANSREGS